MKQKNLRPAGRMAFGGVFAALAIAIMSLGTLIPVATYVCPILCALMLELVRKSCGSSIAWAWYLCVAILSLLLTTDREAGLIILFFGYYPLLKPRLDRLPLPWLWKLLCFNIIILFAYWLMGSLLGMDDILNEWQNMGKLLTGVLLLLGNITFFMLDHLLGMRPGRRHR